MVTRNHIFDLHDEAPPGGIPAGPSHLSPGDTMMRSYLTRVGPARDDLDLVENLLAEAEALSPAYGWDAEAGELAAADPYEDTADDAFAGGWDDPAEAAAVLDQTVIADARLHGPEAGPDEELAAVTALPRPRRTGLRGVAA